MEPVAGTVKAIGAALAYDIDLPAGGAAEADVVVGYADAELIGSFNANGNDRDLIAAPSNDVICDIDAVEIESVLVAARAGNRTARVAKGTSVVGFIWRGAGLEGEKFPSIALECWEV